MQSRQAGMRRGRQPKRPARAMRPLDRLQPCSSPVRFMLCTVLRQIIVLGLIVQATVLAVLAVVVVVVQTMTNSGVQLYTGGKGCPVGGALLGRRLMGDHAVGGTRAGVHRG